MKPANEPDGLSNRWRSNSNPVPVELVQDPRSTLEPGARWLWVVLAEYADKRDQCWPGRALLAERLGCSTRTVTRHIACLVDHGYLKVTPRFETVNGRRRQTSNAYTLTTPNTMTGERDTSDTLSPNEMTGELDTSVQAERRDTSVHPPLDTSVQAEPLTSNELTTTRRVASDLALVATPEVAPEVPRDEGFEDWWKDYPARGGRKRGKADARKLWSKLSRADREAVKRATANYKREQRPGFHCDPPRFLRTLWPDYVAPPTGEGQQREGSVGWLANGRKCVFRGGQWWAESGPVWGPRDLVRDPSRVLATNPKAESA